MKLPEALSLTWIKHIGQWLSLIIFIYIFAAHVIYFIWPSELIVDQKVFSTSYLRLLFFLGFLLGLISWSVSFLEKKLKFVSPLSLGTEEKIIFAASAIFLAIFYNGVFSFLKGLQYALFILLGIFFFIFTPQLINTFLHIRFNDFRSLFQVTYSYRKELLEIFHVILLASIRKVTLVIFIIASIFIILFSYLFISDVVSGYIQGRIYQENIFRKKFSIIKVEPKIATHVQMVKLEGYNFGWKSDRNRRYRVMSDHGQIQPIEEWTNESIKFKVPLYLSPGRKTIWIERPNDDPQRRKVLKSNSIQLDVISRFIIYPDIYDSKLDRIVKRMKRIIFYKFWFFNEFIFTKYE